MKKVNWTVVLAGVVVGIAALALSALGNPANMGFCIACFERDIAGTLGLHSAAVVQYMRPEIIGLVLGALIMALIKGEFRAKGGSSPATRFLLGALVMIGALVFLGCPLRMILRLGGGDLNALVALLGFAAGIFVGTLFLKKGFSLKRTYTLSAAEGSILPAVLILAGAAFVLFPTLFKISTEGPGSMRAPFFIALIIAVVVGALAQRSRLCMVGGLRDAMMFKDFKLLYGFVAIFAITVIGKLALGGLGWGKLTAFKLAFDGQPVAHSNHVWNFLGMALAGWGSVLLGGCPLRQLILAGEGNGDSAVTVFGMIAGAAISHNFGLAGKAGVAAAEAVTTNAKVVLACGFVILLIISFVNLPKAAKEKA